MERPNRPCPGTSECTVIYPVAQEPGYVTTLEPAHTSPAPTLPQMPACHIRPQKWTPRTSAASKYAPFVFIKRKYTSEDEESGGEDAPNVPVAATAGPKAEPKARASEVSVPEVGGGRREQALITYNRRRSKVADRAVARHRPRFKSLASMALVAEEAITQGIVGDQ